MGQRTISSVVRFSVDLCTDDLEGEELWACCKYVSGIPVSVTGSGVGGRRTAPGKGTDRDPADIGIYPKERPERGKPALDSLFWAFTFSIDAGGEACLCGHG